jgi:uncharacterized protein
MRTNYEDLEKLNELFQRGVLTESEFKREKEKILNQADPEDQNQVMGMAENTYCMLIHLSLLLGFFHILLGIIAPLVLWMMRKESNKNIDKHGKIVFNWIFSFMIYSSVLFLLLFPWRMFPGLITDLSFDYTLAFSMFFRFLPLLFLTILNFTFIIIGAIKANSGIHWNYPLSIRFLK